MKELNGIKVFKTKETPFKLVESEKFKVKNTPTVKGIT